MVPPLHEPYINDNINNNINNSTTNINNNNINLPLPYANLT